MKKHLFILLVLGLLNPLSSFSFSITKNVTKDSISHLFKARNYFKNHIGFGIGGNLISTSMFGVEYNFKRYKSNLHLEGVILPPQGSVFNLKEDNEFNPIIWYRTADYYLFGIINPNVSITFRNKNKVKSALTVNWNRVNDKPFENPTSFVNGTFSLNFVQYSINYQRYYQIIKFHSKNNSNGIFLNPTFTINYLNIENKNNYYSNLGHQLEERLLNINKGNIGLHISFIKAFKKNSQAIELGFTIPVFDYYNIKIIGANYYFLNNGILETEHLGSYTTRGKKIFNITEPFVESYFFMPYIKYHIVWNKK